MSVSESDKECPLCMEALDWDDLGFFPCSCGYQICRFCWHRLRTDENGLCPACRQAFPDMPVSFNPEISAEELKKQKRRNRERRSNKEGQVLKPQDLATLRVVQKNLVFIIGLSPRLTQEDLKKEFAHFGKIIKFVHNKSTAYITYSRPEEAIRAIRTLNASAAQEMAVQQLQLQSQLTNGITNTTAPSANIGQNNALTNSVSGLNNASSLLNAISVTAPTNRLKASLGTTKYCNHFLRSQQCPKVGECMYLHEIAEAEASFTKEQMQAGKHVEYEKKLMDSYLAKMDWPANNIAPQNNGFRANQQNNLQQMPQQINQHQTIARQISPQISANQLSPTNQSPSTYDHTRQQSNLNPTTAVANISLQEPITNNSSNNNNNNIGRSSRDLSPDLLPQTSLLTQSLLQQANHHQPSSNHSPNLIRHPVSASQTILDSHQSGESINQAANLLLRAQQPHPSHQASLSRQQQQQQQQLALDADSDDDGLDFDPISVSTNGLRDLLDQQVHQAKQQFQMQNYLQQMNSNQSLASVLFQQNNRLNQNVTPANRLLSESTFNGHGPSVPPLASLNTTSNHQEQVAWHNWSSWTNFLQRSGYGFENSK